VQGALTFPEGAVRWVRAEGFHLTLEFLGDTDEGDVPKIIRALETAAAQTAPFTLTLAGVGSFGRPPRVLYVRVGGDLGALHALRQRVAPSTTTFTPHLTLGRVRQPRPQRPSEVRLPEVAVPEAAWRVPEVRLYRSILDPQGARHLPLASCALRG